MSEDISKRLIFSSNRVDKEKNYWLNKLAGEITRSYFPYDYNNRIDTPNQTCHQWEFMLPEELIIKLNRVTNNSNHNLYSLFLVAVTLLLHKYTGNTDILIGAPIYKQQSTGNFINTVLIIRNEFSPKCTFKELILQVKQNLSEANENMNYPLERLFYHLDIPELIENFSYFFETVLLMENIHDRKYILNIKPGIIFSFRKDGDRLLKVIVEFRDDLYRMETIRRIAGHFINLLQDMEKNINQSVLDIDILLREEKQQLLFELNNTNVGQDGQKDIIQLFEDQVEKYPDHKALVGITPDTPESSISYVELSEKSSRMASILIEKGISRGNIAAIIAEPLLELIIGVLAILKCGAAYLPIDPEMPDERKEFMLQDSGAKILLTPGNLPKENEKIGGQELESIVMLLRNTNTGFTKFEPAIGCRPLVSSPAYVIYTSGTTGSPKGTMITQRNLVNYTGWLTRMIALTPYDRTILTSSFAFDLIYTSVYGALLCGGELHIVPKELYVFSEMLLQYIKKKNITFLKLTPSLFSIMIACPDFNVNTCHSLRVIMLGGEPIHVPDVEIAHQKCSHIKILNHYGPTETTIGTVSQYIDFDRLADYRERPSIGKPIANMTVYILDRHLNLMPFGAVGELAVGGNGLSLGYINRPELTSEKFVYLELTSHFVYKTGDLCRWLPDGNIQFLGRRDDQIKIRGFRIELREIEKQLLKLEQIKKAVVVVKTNPDGHKFLCSYFVSSAGEVDGKSITVEMLRKHLARVLPEYMIPSYFMALETIPLTLNGKIDKRALPEPKALSSTDYIAPQNDTESALVDVWQSVFNIEKIGVNDNFFELGGDSIKAIQISARLLKKGLKMSVKDLFANPIIKDLEKNIEQVQRVIDQGNVEGDVPLTPSQYWFFNSYSRDRHHFNMPIMLHHVSGKIDESLVEKVLEKITDHHDVLRMVYIIDEKQILQKNRGLGSKNFSLEIIRLDNEIDTDIEKEIEKHANRLQRGIDLQNGPLLMAGLFKTPLGDHLLLVTHHLVMDGISLRILIEDFSIGYMQIMNGEEIKLQEKTDSFLHWSHKLHEYAQSNNALKEFAYWKEIEAAKIESLSRDHLASKEEKKIKNNDSLQFTLSETETEKLLKEINRSYNTGINDILLTALGMTINDWAGMENILVNMEGHGREPIMGDVTIDRTMGWFTSHFPVKINIKKSDSISYKIKTIKETLRKIPNKGIGYGILKYLTPGEKKQGIQFTCEPEINFNYLGQINVENQINTKNSVFNISSIKIGDIRSPEMEEIYTMDISGIVLENKFTLSISYNKFEYSKSTIERFLNFFRTNLIAIIQHCLGKETSELTPSDVGDEDLSIEDLNEIQKMIQL